LATGKDLVVENPVLHIHTGHQKVEALNQIPNNWLQEAGMGNEDLAVQQDQVLGAPMVGSLSQKGKPPHHCWYPSSPKMLFLFDAHNFEPV